MPPKPKRITHRNIYLLADGVVEDDVEVAWHFGIEVSRVDRRWNDTFADRFDADDGFSCAGSAEHVAHGRLGRADVETRRGVAKHFLDCLHLAYITHRRGCSVRVEVVDVRRGYSRVFERPLHSKHCTFSLGMCGCKMIRFGWHAATRHFRVDAGTAPLRVFILFQYQGTCPFTHHEPVTVRIEGAGCLLRIIVACRQRFHGGEPTHTSFVDRRFRTTGDDHVRLSPTNVIQG